MRTLSPCNQSLIRAGDEPSWLQQVCKIIVEEAGFRMCWVGYAEQDEAKMVRPLARVGFEQGYLDSVKVTWADTERGQGPTGTCPDREVFSDRTVGEYARDVWGIESGAGSG